MRSLTLSQLLGIRTAVGVLAVVLFCAPAYAAKVPSKEMQDILVKSSILSFNDANVTGIYDVLRAKTSKAFRDKFSVENLAEAFKSFRDKGVNLLGTVVMTVTYTEPATVNDDDALSLNGYFDTSPNKTYFSLQFVMSDGEWRLTKINVKLEK
jgi:hypothetical protein